MDAIVATAAALTVLEPTSNGLGSDAFALVWQNNALHGLNASGPAPQAISIEKVLARHGGPAMPRYGWTPVTVPGAVGAWAALSARFGKLPFATLLEPAIAYASEGYPVPPMLAFLVGRSLPDPAGTLHRAGICRLVQHFCAPGTGPAGGRNCAPAPPRPQLAGYSPKPRRRFLPRRPGGPYSSRKRRL